MEEINTDFWKIIGHSIKHGGLGLPDPRLSKESVYNNSKAASGELVDSPLGYSTLNYVGHRACVGKARLMARQDKMHVELGELARHKELVGGQERNRLHRVMRNLAWLSAIPHRLNGMELSLGEFRDNLCLRYRLMTQDIPTTCDGCGKKLLIELALSCTKDSLVLALNDNAAKEWGALGAQALVSSAITYKPKINSRTVKGEITGAGAR